MSHTFKGGVHPNYMKAPEVPVTVIAPPPQVVIPMAQHIGAPCKPLVSVGDYVKMGQKIGENPAPVSAPVHASVSGKVVAVEARPHPLGDMIMSVVIENDGLDTPCEDMAPLTEEQLKDPEAILDRIREAGIVGHGGAMFPTAFKIRGGLGKVDTLIINGAECEPYLNGDHLTMKNHPEELLKGIELARIASGLDKAYYGIEKNKQDAIDLLLSKNPAQYGVEIVPENVKYPQGAEKMQIKAITNREVKPGGLPSGVGCNVISTQTAYAIYRACYEGMPSIERVLTVAGSAMGDKSCNLQCRFGTPFSYIVEQCGGFVARHIAGNTFRPAVRHDGGDLLAALIRKRHGRRKGLQQVVDHLVDGIGRHIGRRALHLDRPLPRKVDVESKRREFHGVLLEQRIFVARQHQPLGKEQLLAHGSPVSEHLQVILVKNALTGTPHVHHDEPPAQQCGEVPAAQRQGIGKFRTPLDRQPLLPGRSPGRDELQGTRPEPGAGLHLETAPRNEILEPVGR